MSILKIYQGPTLARALAEIVGPVAVTYAALDQPEPDTIQALADLMALTPYLTVTISPARTEPADRVSVQGKNGGPLIFVGAPIGTELAALVSAIIVAGRGRSGLSPATRRALAHLPFPIHLEVFTTPTWPNCAHVVSLAHKFAFENPQIMAEAISAVAMPDLTRQYKVPGTPHLVLNGTYHLKGRITEERLRQAFSQP